MNDWLPDYKARKAFAAAYGWELSGWPSKPLPTSVVSLFRWEDALGNIVPAPPVIECDPPMPGIMRHVIKDGQPHQVFLTLPYYADIATWESLLFDHLVRRTIAKSNGAG